MIKKTLTSKILPLMLAVSIVTTFMYIYNKNQILLFAVLSFVLQLGVFIFYDFFSAKGTVGKYCSILGGFAVIAILYFMATSGQSSSDGIDFMIWFLSPQAAVAYSAQYTYTLFLGFCFFTGSTVYYFTQVRYRIFVTFLILMIPLAIFAKESETVPFVLLAMLLIFYTAVMIHCRQTAESEKKSNVKIILDNAYKKSAAIFVFATVILSFAIPKPQVEANRDFFETMISANGLTQYLLSKLGDFSDTSGGSGFTGNSRNTRLFYCYSEEPLNLKSKTFTNYNREDDTWYVSPSYDRIYISEWEQERKNLNPAKFLDAVYSAGVYDNDFADKYNIQYKSPNDYDLSVYTKSMTIIAGSMKPYYLLSPSHAFSAGEENEFLMSPSGGIIKFSFDDYQEKTVNDAVTISYYSDMLSDSEYARGVLDNLDIENYDDFLSELYDVLEENNADDELINTVEYFTDDYKNAVNYYNGIDYEVDDDTIIYQRESENKITEYAPSKELLQLAEEITEGCNSDIEKAEALEMYFFNNDFTYDAEYVKADGDNVDDFLFESKKGACYEYSTAMVLLARSLGMPARYNEGFMLSDYDDTYKTFVISENNSHAYPEVFISGYGWLVFEPTITSDAGNTNKGFTSQQMLITFICIGAVVAVIIGVLFMTFVYPVIYEKYFRYKIKKSKSDKSVVRIISRLRKLTDTAEYVTADELAEFFRNKYDIDISSVTELFNVSVYGNSQTEYSDNSEILDIYITAYEKIKDFEKNKNKK